MYLQCICFGITLTNPFPYSSPRAVSPFHIAYIIILGGTVRRNAAAHLNQIGAEIQLTAAVRLISNRYYGDSCPDSSQNMYILGIYNNEYLW